MALPSASTAPSSAGGYITTVITVIQTVIPVFVLFSGLIVINILFGFAFTLYCILAIFFKCILNGDRYFVEFSEMNGWWVVVGGVVHELTVHTVHWQYIL